MSGADVLERKILHPGKPFIVAGEENTRAYVIQKGMVASYVTDGDQKIEVARYGPGTIIGEVSLMLDDPINMSFEAVVDSTVVTITRQDFSKKLQRIDTIIQNILVNLMQKLQQQDETAISKARKNAEIDEQAFQMVRALIAKLPEDKQYVYEKKILPHMNNLIKTLKELRQGVDTEDLI